MDFLEPTKETEFNQGLATIYRLDAYWKDLANAYHSGELKRAFINLKLIYKEISPQLKQPDRDEHIKQWKNVKNCYNKILEAHKKGYNLIPDEWVDSFDEWELMLRDSQQKVGLGVPSKKDPRYALK